MDLFTYLRQHEPHQLEHVAGNTYCTREHDSLKISNGKWCWFSRGRRGAAQRIIEALADSPYQVIDDPPTHGKDVNDQLRWELQTKEKEHER